MALAAGMRRDLGQVLALINIHPGFGGLQAGGGAVCRDATSSSRSLGAPGRRGLLFPSAGPPGEPAPGAGSPASGPRPPPQPRLLGPRKSFPQGGTQALALPPVTRRALCSKGTSLPRAGRPSRLPHGLGEGGSVSSVIIIFSFCKISSPLASNLAHWGLDKP